MKQINNFEEKYLTNNMKIDQFKGLASQNYYSKIQKLPNKQFYFELEFKSEYNPHFNQPTSLIPVDYQVFTPKINNITMKMPSVPLLSNLNEIKPVILIQSIHFNSLKY